MRKILLYLLAAIQIFVSLGAIICGVLLILAPDGRHLQLSLSLLAKTPFRDFLFPGLILFLINGIGQGIAAVLTIRKHRQAGLIAGIFGVGLLIWIFVQVSMIGGGDGLQYTYFTIGITETVLAFFADRFLVRQAIKFPRV